MFNNATDLKSLNTSGNVFVNQDSVAVYEKADSESGEVARLQQGAQFTVIDSVNDLPSSWIHIRALDGNQGYVKDSTKALTPIQVRGDYDRLLGGIKLGWVKIGTGSALCFAGAAVTIVSLMHEAGPGIIWYGAILVGLGQVGWGIEQLAFTRRARKQYELVWRNVIR